MQISIHALREEGDECNKDAQDWFHVFLSTPSVRRATLDSVQNLKKVNISIHALREEGD